jgi:Na+-transporting NADH:ubiquinone oxidoreductase subunit A
MIQIKKGLTLPIEGAPQLRIDKAPPLRRVALLGTDYLEMKPDLRVAEGDLVRLGQPLFTDKKNPAVVFTAPAAGRVAAINRGERRVFLSLEIELTGTDECRFSATPVEKLPSLKAEEVEQRLVEAGLWPALRTRPFSKVPMPGSRPAALFVTAMDTNPLAADPQVIIAERVTEFKAGLQALSRLSAGKTYVCQAPGAQIPRVEGVEVREFGGCHPAGLAGTHIHFLEKVNQQRVVWSVGYQDVIAIGYLLLQGRILSERIIALGGPGVKEPRLLRTQLGACLSELVAGQLTDGEQRVISGSVLCGRKAEGAQDFLGRYHQQVSVLPEARQREFLGWGMPGLNKFSVKRLFAASLLPRRPLALTTSTHGSLRAMVPTGAFEQVMPLHIKATWLLRALLTGDSDLAQNLGCLELDEEDLALCSFVCSGKMNYGDYLRRTLLKIEKEG